MTIDSDDKSTVAEVATLTISDGITLTNKGILVNYGTITADTPASGKVLTALKIWRQNMI